MLIESDMISCLLQISLDVRKTDIKQTHRSAQGARQLSRAVFSSATMWVSIFDACSCKSVTMFSVLV